MSPYIDCQIELLEDIIRKPEWLVSAIEEAKAEGKDTIRLWNVKTTNGTE